MPPLPLEPLAITPPKRTVLSVAIILVLVIVSVVLAVQRYKHCRMSSTENMVSKAQYEVIPSCDKKTAVTVKLPAYTYDSSPSQSPTTEDNSIPVMQAKPMTSGEMARLLSLPIPTVRRRSYPLASEETLGDECMEGKNVTKIRIGSITSIQGVSMERKELILERGGWKRHAIVFGSTLPAERNGIQ
jgi:hypothetical protein